MSDAMTALIISERDRAYERGLQSATGINLGESGYGSTHSAVVAIEFKKLSELKSVIRDRRWRRYGDNPGQAFMGTCELIYIHTTDWGKTTLLICATHYDI